MSYRLKPFSLLVFIIIAISCLVDVNAQQAVIPGAIRVDATFENISINYSITGDDNLDSQLSIRYRAQGSSTYLNAAMTIRAHPNLIIDGSSLNMNFHAGSVMHLNPNITYDIELTLTDPDGGGSTQTIQATTKAIPMAATSSIKYVAPGNGGGAGTQSNPYLGLQAAASNASAGDHFIVASGTYDPFSITQSGTAGNPISFESETLHAAVIEGANTNVGIVTIGSFSINTAHVIIDGFTIQNGERGIDAQNTSFVTARNNMVLDVDYGYVNRRENGVESDQYITNNVFEGRSAYPGSGIPAERCIDIRGNNNVVSHNTIKDFADGVSTDGPPYYTSYSLDIHHNEIQNIVDDHIEIDGIISNARVYRNRCFNGRAGVSIAPIFGGPAYVFRNEIFNYENSAFKMNRGPSGIIIANNTIVSNDNAIESPNGWQNTFYRNNVAFSSRYCFEFFDVVAGSTDDWDYDGYHSTRSGTSGSPWFKWDDVRYANVPVLNSSDIIEANAIAVDFSDFENIALPSPYGTIYLPSTRDLYPTSASNAIDAGVTLDNINDPYVTDNSTDLGALEYGELRPVYGAVFNMTTSNAHIVTDDDCIQIFPNPFTDKVIVDGIFTNFTIHVLDVTGAVVANYTGTTAPLVLDLSALGNGIYFVRIQSTIHNYLSLQQIIKGL